MERKNDRDTARELERALARMSRLRRKIFLAVRLDGMDYEEVARRMGLSVRRVERELAKALRDLDAAGGRSSSLNRRRLWPWSR